MLKIETNVPLPMARASSRYDIPWKNIEVGQSVLVPSAEPLRRMRLQSNLLTYARKTLPDWKFTTRLEDGGVRIWRIA